MKKTLLLIGILATAFQVSAQSTDELYTVVSKYTAQTGSTTRMGNHFVRKDVIGPDRGRKLRRIGFASLEDQSIFHLRPIGAVVGAMDDGPEREEGRGEHGGFHPFDGVGGDGLDNQDWFSWLLPVRCEQKF